MAKQKSIQQLVKELDKVFSLYIRHKYAVKGYVACYTCPTVKPIKEMQCGHFLSRRHMAIRWHENNARPQCVSDNIFNQGSQDIFGQKLRKEIGEKAVDMLHVMSKQYHKLDRFTLETSIKFYKDKLKELTKN